MNKKKKVSRSAKMLVLLGCLVVVVGGYALTKSLVAKSEAEAEADSTINFVSVQDPVEMTWTYSGQTYTVELDEDSIWMWTDDDEFELNQTSVEAMATAVSSITASQVLTGVTDYGQYGLEDPDSVITVKTSDGKTYTILTGDYNSTAASYYAMLEGASDVYLVTGEYLDNFEYSIDELEATTDEEEQ